MKKIILALSLVLSTMIASAHYITPYAYCSIKQVVTMNITNWDIGSHNTAYFYATKNGSQDSSKTNPVIWSVTVNLSAYTKDVINDSVGQIYSTGFKINIPYTISTLYGYENESGGYNKVVWTSGNFNYKSLTDQCVVLPVTLDYFGAQQSGNSIVFTWEAMMEINIDHYEIIRVANDGSESVVAKIPSKSPNGTSTEKVDYSYAMDSKPFLAAGFTSIIAMILIVSLIVSKKNRKVLMPALMLVFGLNLASCTKSEATPKNTLNSAEVMFKLKSVDINGKSFVYNTVPVKIVAQPQ